MKKHTLLTISISMAAGLFLSACVTINIYFPAAAAEKRRTRLLKKSGNWNTKKNKKMNKPLFDSRQTAAYRQSLISHFPIEGGYD